jgi:hypothetical protein
MATPYQNFFGYGSLPQGANVARGGAVYQNGQRAGNLRPGVPAVAPRPQAALTNVLAPAPAPVAPAFAPPGGWKPMSAYIAGYSGGPYGTKPYLHPGSALANADAGKTYNDVIAAIQAGSKQKIPIPLQSWEIEGYAQQPIPTNLGGWGPASYGGPAPSRAPMSRMEALIEGLRRGNTGDSTYKAAGANAAAVDAFLPLLRQAMATGNVSALTPEGVLTWVDSVGRAPGKAAHDRAFSGPGIGNLIGGLMMGAGMGALGAPMIMKLPKVVGSIARGNPMGAVRAAVPTPSVGNLFKW